MTVLFDADVDKQGGAYATGVLMLMSSAAVAVTIALPKQRKLFAPIMLVFVYTTVLNVFERPEGIKIAVVVHPRHHRVVAGLARDARHRAADGGHQLRRGRRRVHR